MKYLIAISALVFVLAPGAAMPAGLDPAGFSPLWSVGGTANPLRIAVDAEGRFYVADSIRRTVDVYGNSGRKLYDIRGVGEPLGVGFSNGSAFIGDGADGSVKVYDSEGLYSHSVGTGQILEPGGVAVSPSGEVYVADSAANDIKVFAPDGSFAFGFGAGLVSSPTDVALSPLTGDVYVVDRNNKRIAVFDSAGNQKGSMGEAYVSTPSGMGIDGSGNVFVSDSYQDTVYVFDAAGAYLGSIGSFGPSGGSLRTPIDVAVDNLNKVFVTSLNSQKIVVFGSADSNGLMVAPDALAFSVGQGEADSSVIAVDSQNASLGWTALSDAGWLVVEPSFGNTPSECTVSVNAAGLAEGTYKGTVRIRENTSGVTEVVNASLEVIAGAYVLDVLPASVALKAQANGQPKTASLFIMGTEGLQWSVDPGTAVWLTAAPLSGAVPGAAILALDPANMAPATYSSSVTVSAAGNLAPPVTVPVSFELIDAGNIKVMTNLGLATFEITGPRNYNGSGTDGEFLDVPTGAYTVTFGPVGGFKEPSSVDFKVESGKTATVPGDYRDLRERNNILVSIADGPSSLTDEIRVHEATGNPAGTVPVSARTGGRKGMATASGDLDGDGSEEIIVSHDLGIITGYRGDGTPIDGLCFRAFPYKSQVDLAVADLDGDGRGEIVAGAATGVDTPAAVRVFRYTGGEVAGTGLHFLAYEENKGVRVAAGDVDGDGVSEILTVQGASEKVSVVVRIWKVLSSGGGALEAADAGWFAAGVSSSGSDIAAGDLDADGLDEVVVSTVPSGGDAVIAVYMPTGFRVREFTVAGSQGAYVAAGDTDFDGRAEIAAGDVSSGGVPAVRVYDADGVLKSEFASFDNKTAGGLNVSMGQVSGR